MYDLYSGIGTIGLTLAREALTVWGIEYSEESVACAVENAGLNGISNAAFFVSRRRSRPRRAPRPRGPPDVIVVDPPRAGLVGKAVRRIAVLEAPRLVCVSCNPTTLMRQREGARPGARLPPRAREARRHVPAHAPRGDGRALHAGALNQPK